MKNPSMKNFCVGEILIIPKQKRKYYDFARAINCTPKLTSVRKLALLDLFSLYLFTLKKYKAIIHSQTFESFKIVCSNLLF